jgi:hypothetical protein
LQETVEMNSLRGLDSPENSRKRAVQLGAPSLVGGFIQGACALLMATNAGKALLGIASTTVAARSSFIHSDPIRIPLMIISALGALAVLYVLWNGWRLRNSPAAQWRRQPLSRRERWSVVFALASSLLTLALVVGEYFAHPIMHPR